MLFHNMQLTHMFDIDQLFKPQAVSYFNIPVNLKIFFLNI